MDAAVRKHFENIYSANADTRYESFKHLITLTYKSVDWAYEVWDDLLLMLKSKNNHQRAIAAQLLSGLAKSDTEQRLLKDLPKLMEVTKDEKFVTARHSLQSLWKPACAYPELQKKVITGLVDRFNQCSTEKNCTLVRYDIIEVFRKLYDQLKDTAVKDKALALIDTEPNLKYRKKYAGLWKDLT